MPDAGEAQLRVFNGRNCDYAFNSNIPDHTSFSLKAMEHFVEQHINIDGGNSTFWMTVQSATPQSCLQDVGANITVRLEERTSRGLFLTGNAASVLTTNDYEDSIEKSRRGWPYVRILANIETNEIITLVDKKGNERFNATRTSFDRQDDVPTDKFEVFVSTRSILNDLELKLGGVYTLLVTQTGGNNYATELKIVTEPNSMNMLWLIPQYVVMTLGEVSQSDALNVQMIIEFYSRSCTLSLVCNFHLIKLPRV